MHVVGVCEIWGLVLCRVGQLKRYLQDCQPSGFYNTFLSTTKCRIGQFFRHFLTNGACVHRIFLHFYTALARICEPSTLIY